MSSAPVDGRGQDCAVDHRESLYKTQVADRSLGPPEKQVPWDTGQNGSCHFAAVLGVRMEQKALGQGPQGCSITREWKQ